MNNKTNGEYRTHLMLCGGTGCVSNGSMEIKKLLETELEKHGLQSEVSVIMTGCNGFCGVGPIMTVMPDNIFYQNLTPETIPNLVEEHFLKGRPVEKLMYKHPDNKSTVPKLMDISFFARQTLIALRNRGMIDPENIDEYIARDGYKALAKALTEMTVEQVIAEVKESGLRGRGGGGFPTGLKWELCRKQVLLRREKEPDAPCYIICNADEGDPGAFMDRSIIELDPHSVIEGMLIAALAIGSNLGFVYIRAEYPLAIKRLEVAINQARDYGLLGKNIFDTDFSFDIEIREGAGAFVCGEETALMNSIMGLSPEPVQKPPFPAQSGLWGCPTNINNVETWANIPPILIHGAEWFKKIGTEKSCGTKVFSLVGKINNTGLIEIPMGIPLKDIIYDIGGGIPGGKAFKAVQTGGPSGGCIPASLIDLEVDFERLTQAGSIMGSGGMIVMDEDNCMVDVARYFIEFTSEESCGKCSSCRDGSIALLRILERICDGKGTPDDIPLLKELCVAIIDASLCGLGKTLPNPVLSTLKYFENEYLEHINNKCCPAAACRELITFNINDKCVGCTMCAKACPVSAISGEVKKRHVLDQKLCTKCGACYEVCKFKAVDRK